MGQFYEAGAQREDLVSQVHSIVMSHGRVERLFLKTIFELNNCQTFCNQPR